MFTWLGRLDKVYFVNNNGTKLSTSFTSYLDQVEVGLKALDKLCSPAITAFVEATAGIIRFTTPAGFTANNEEKNTKCMSDDTTMTYQNETKVLQKILSVRTVK